MKNKLTSIICTCVVLLLSASQISAQEKGVYEINPSDASRSDFYNLAFRLHPTIYVKNNLVKKIYGEGDIKKITLKDTSSFNILFNSDTRYKTIELLTIEIKTLNELESTQDLSNLSGFDNLKYIYVKIFFELKNEYIPNFIKTNPNIRVFYMHGNPS